MRNKRPTLAAPPPDPFGERRHAAFRERLQLLGGRFEFETDSRRLQRLVRTAFAGLPAHKFAPTAPRFRMRLVATPARGGRSAQDDPPAVRGLAGAGLLCGAMDPATFVSVAVPQRAALLVASRQALRYPYHVRYELLEFAVYLLAARVQRLVPLHAGCVGRGGEGVLLMGASGAGKSTVVLHCLLGGLDLLAEDSVLVHPASLRATGIATFLHLRQDALRFVDRPGRSVLVHESTLIRRRSGVRKLEIDLRHCRQRLAAAPLRLRAVVFLTRGSARGRSLLARLSRPVVLRRLEASQRYAAKQPGWKSFRAQLARLPGYELRRGRHPREAAAALRDLLSDEHGRA